MGSRSVAMISTLLRLALLVPCLLLAACGAHLHHRVEPGETLYSIGWLYGYDYRSIARWNGIAPPYRLHPGQVLLVAPPSADASPPPHTAAAPAPRHGAPVLGPTASSPPSAAKAPQATAPAAGAHSATTAPAVPTAPVRVSPYVKGLPRWRWPTNSRNIARTFLPSDPARQGIDIAGRRGDPIYAAAPGKVVYAGSGLARYGRLIIIKHNEKYLSAYAHNDKLLVEEGMMVDTGQRIAQLGSSGIRRPRLHFEIRYNGKPVDPLRYLPRH